MKLSQKLLRIAKCVEAQAGFEKAKTAAIKEREIDINTPVSLYMLSGWRPKVWSGTLQKFFASPYADITSATMIQIINKLKFKGKVLFGGGPLTAYEMSLK
jgi:hypothetical protein